MKKFSLPLKAKKQLKKLGIMAIYLFGSRAQGVAGPLSDYDFGILTKESGFNFELYLKLFNIFSPLCPRKFPNDIIDIVFLGNASLELQMHVVRHGVVLFDSNLNYRLDYENLVMQKTADFAQFRKEYSEILLKRI